MQAEVMKQIDQAARAYRKKAALELTIAFASALVNRVPPEADIDVDALTDDAIQLTKAQLAKLVAEKII